MKVLEVGRMNVIFLWNLCAIHVGCCQHIVNGISEFLASKCCQKIRKSDCDSTEIVTGEIIKLFDRFVKCLVSVSQLELEN